MYKLESRVRYSECGPDDKLTISALVDYFQDCTNQNSEKLGVGVEYLMKKKRAWIINSWQIVINRFPKCGEKIEVFTWATGFKGVFGPRDFCMKTPEGEMLACAHTLWVYIDTETGRPTKPDKEEMELYGCEPPLELESASRKIQLPEDMQVVDTFPVRKYHIDTNNHVNNSKYVQIAAEVIPEDFRVTGIRVEYKKSAVFGDKMTLKCRAEENRIVTGLCDAEGTIYAIIDFIGEN